LRAAGFSEERARRLLLASVWVDSTEEMRRDFADQDQYWRSDRGEGMAERYLQNAQRRREREAALREVLGDDYPAGGMIGSFWGVGTGGIPPEKLSQVQMVEEDYQILQMELRRQAGSVLFPEDQEALRLLEKEKREI
jgi:hypothetical protein